MKKIIKIAVAFLCIAIIVSLVGCVNFSTDKEYKDKRSCTITFNYNNGDASEEVFVKNGKRLSMPEDPQKANHFFVGWYTDKGCTKEYDFSQIVKNDFTLYAKYERIYSVTFNYNNGSANKTVSLKSGDTLSMPRDPQKENYIFIGWYVDRGCTKKYDFSQIVESDFTLYAKYEIDAATIPNNITKNTLK